jgi:4-hydroxy-tetrahydrodipicolinate reductase
MEESWRVGVIGAAGRMGLEICRMLPNTTELTPCAALDKCEIDKDWGQVAGIDANGISIMSDIGQFLALMPDVVVDVSVGNAVSENIPLVLKAGINTVIGATGILTESIDEFEKLAIENGVCCLIVPNFSIGANLMVEMARKAAPFYTNAEIVERHHAGKQDAPSGTALFTVSEMALANPKLTSSLTKHEMLAGARGGTLDEIRIHSVRLPGILAEQTVMFGSQGETLEITHRSINRECYMLGIALAIRFVMNAEPGLIIGLDQVLDYVKEG